MSITFTQSWCRSYSMKLLICLISTKKGVSLITVYPKSPEGRFTASAFIKSGYSSVIDFSFLLKNLTFNFWMVAFCVVIGIPWHCGMIWYMLSHFIITAWFTKNQFNVRCWFSSSMYKSELPLSHSFTDHEISITTEQITNRKIAHNSL